MSFEFACSQFPIAKTLINNLKSMKDFDSLTQTSRQIKYSLINNSVRKTFNVINNTLIFDHERLARNIEVTWDNISVLYDGSECTFSALDQLFNDNEEENFEHIHTISLRLYDIYDNYEDETRLLFAQYCAEFIDKMFARCHNATILELIDIQEIQFYIVNYVKSPRIQTIKKLNFNELIEYSIKNPESISNVIDQLSRLKEMYLFIKHINLYNINSFENVLSKLFKQFSLKKDFMLHLSGRILPKDSKKFGKILLMAKENNLSLSINGSFICNNHFFETIINKSSSLNNSGYSINNVKQLSICLWDKRIFQTFFKALPSFINLIKLKIELRDQLFENIIENNLSNLISLYIDSTVLQKLPQIEEIFLEIQNSQLMYKINENYEKSFEIKDKMVADICLLLGVKLKTLFLKGVPNLTEDVGQYLSNKCPNLENVHLFALNTISPNFVEEMKNLKFINLKGIHKLNIPQNVKMMIIYSNNDNFSKEIAQLSNDDSYNYFKNFYSKNFKHAFRNICDGYVTYNVFFDSILDWISYLKHLNIFAKTPY